MPSTNLRESLPDVVIFVRHTPDSPHKGASNIEGVAAESIFGIPIAASRNVLSAKTRSWSQAEKQRVDLLKQFGVTEDPLLESADRTTISRAVEVFLTRKRTENASVGVVKKYKRELERLSAFCFARGKMFPEALTLPLLEEFRATWATDYPSSQTRARVQQRLKGFLNFCHDARYLSHVPRLTPIKVDEPPTLPLTDQQFESLLAHVSTTFSDAEKARKVRALVRLMRHSGLSIMDAVTLERKELRHDTKKKIFRIVTSRMLPARRRQC